MTSLANSLMRAIITAMSMIRPRINPMPAKTANARMLLKLPDDTDTPVRAPRVPGTPEKMANIV